MNQKNKKNGLDELIKWANDSGVPDTKEGREDYEGNVLGLPRDGQEILEVKNLFLGGNKLEKLPKELPGLLNNLPKLTGLFLNGNLLGSLPESFDILLNLKYLNLGDNLLGELPESFGELRNLRKLNLSYNLSLKILPDSFACLSNLTHLDLANTELVNTDLREWQKLIEKLPKLESLDLSDNYLLKEFPKFENLIQKRVPVKFDDYPTQDDIDKANKLPKIHNLLRSLKYLDLHSCRLAKLPESFCRFSLLTWLDLRNNNLTELPERIHNLSNLTYLDLRNNNLTTLQESFGRLKKLRRVRMGQKNHIKELPPYLSHMADIVDFDEDDED